MKRLLCYAVLTLTISGCAHWRLNLLRAEQLAVNGVVIGSLRPAVIERLGEPAAREAGFDDLMDMGAWEDLHYPGLTVKIIQPEADRDPYVTGVAITDRSWQTASGLRVGDTATDVRGILGRPERIDVDGEGDPYWYFLTTPFDGRVVVTFRDDRVIEIRIEEDWS